MRRKNKICPYRRECRDECYGESTCCFALAFDGLQSKIDTLRQKNKALTERIEKLEENDG